MVIEFLADGFEETEAIAPIDMMRRARIDVVTVGVTGKIVISSHKVPVTADITIDKLNLTRDIEAVVLPGGGLGTQNEEASEGVQAAIDFAVKNGLYVCAICAAPSILGHKGLLEGKKAACYSGFEKDLIGAEIHSDEGVVVDGKFVTARGAGVATEFGLKIVEVLRNKALADDVKNKILMD